MLDKEKIIFEVIFFSQRRCPELCVLPLPNPPHPYIEAKIPNVMVLGDKVLGR